MFLVEYPVEAEVGEILAELEQVAVVANANTEMRAGRRPYTEPVRPALHCTPRHVGDHEAWYVRVTLLTTVLPLAISDSTRALVRILMSAIAHRVADNRPPSTGQVEIALVFEMPGPGIAFLYDGDDLDDLRAWGAMFMLIGDCQAEVSYAWDPARGRWYVL